MLAFLAPLSRAQSQDAPRTQVEARIDGFTGDDWAVHAGVGISAPLGTYVRFGPVAGVGTGAHGVSSRIDLVARFTLDPFREKPWAPFAVGGISARFDDSSRQYLVLMAGIEGPVRRGWATALEFGFGGAFRAGVALRQATPKRR